MAGTLVIDTLNASSGPLLTNNGMTGIAKAWCNYNGVAGTITASFNVSSVTKNGTGDYTFTFTTAMSNANYTISGASSWVNGVSAAGFPSIRNEAGYTPTSSACRVLYQGQNGTAYERDYAYLVINGN
jgi:hypothetical protein